MKKSILVTTTALLAMLTLADGASAATTFTYDSYSVVDNTNVVINAGPTQGTYGSGQIILNGSGADAGTTLKAWCIDVYHDLLGSSTDSVVAPSLNDAGGQSGASIINATTLGEIGALIHYGDSQIANGNTAISPAVQLAIWSVEYAGLGYSFTSSDSSVNSEVNTLVADVSGPNPTLAPFTNLREVITLDANGNALNQGLAFEVSAVPLPAAFPMFGAGLVGFGAMARKRRNRTA